MDVSDVSLTNATVIMQHFNAEQLKDECLKRGLNGEGNKKQLANRIREDNQKIPGNDSIQITSELMYRLVSTLESTQKSTLEALQVIANKEAKINVIANPDITKMVDMYTGAAEESLKDWINQLEMLKSQQQWNDTTVIQAASGRMEENAKHWHRNIGYKINDWKLYVKLIEDAFGKPVMSRLWAKSMLDKIQSVDESVSKYCYTKLSLMNKCPHPLSDDCKVDWILSGLKNEHLRNMMQTRCDSDKMTVETLIAEVIKTDTRMLNESKDSIKQPFRSSRIISQQREWAPRYNPQQMNVEGIVCYRCQQKGHLSKDCTKSRSPPRNYGYRKPELGKPKTTAVAYGLDSKQVIPTLNPNRMVIPVKINLLDVIGFIDPGAEVSLIRHDLIKLLQVEVQAWTHGEIEALNGTLIEPIGTISNVLIEIGGFKAFLPFVRVMKDLPDSIVIGNDWKKIAHVTIGSTEDNDVEIALSPRLTASYALIKSSKDSDFSYNRAKINYLTQNAVYNQIESIQVSPQVTSVQLNLLHTLLKKHLRVFSKDKTQVGFCPFVRHEIHLCDDIPIRMQAYKLPRTDQEFLKIEIDEMKKAGVITDSNSSYASPCLVVHNPLHTSSPKRMVTDFRKLNDKTIKDPYPMTDLKSTFDAMGGANFYSKMDIKRAFYNIEIKPEHRPYTAFVTQDGHYEYVRMAQGLCNSPATLVRGLTMMKRGTDWEPYVEFYMDDIAIHTDTVEKHLEVMSGLLCSLSENGYLIDLDKSEFLQENIKFLGFIVGREGLQIDPKRVEAIFKHDKLKSITEVRSFLGLASHFRKFIKDFSKIANPLIMLTKTKDAKPFNWTKDCDEAMDKIKLCLTTPPVLRHFDPKLKTDLYVDASGQALGAVLKQTDETGKEQVVEYASCTLSVGDRKKHSNELEAIAVHWAVQKKFKLYLLGLPSFTIWTDNWAVSHLSSKKNLNTRLARIAMDLLDFNFFIKHHSGKVNEVADALSRPPSIENTFIAYAVLRAHDHRIIKLQQEDEELQSIIELFDKPTLNKQQLQKKRTYDLIDNILYKRENGSQKRIYIVVPQELKESLLERVHDESGHSDAERTLNRIKRKYWWKGMVRDTHEYIQGCLTCQRINHRTNQRTGEMSYREIPDTPFHTISIDHEGPIRDKDDCGYFICAVDHFTRFIVTKPVLSKRSTETIEFLEELGEERGWPTALISDNDSSYTSQKALKFYEQHGIKKIYSIPYRSQSNGIVERAIGKLLSVVRKLMDENPYVSWKSLLRKATLLTNTTIHEGLKCSPFQLLYGYEPRLHQEKETYTTDLNRENHKQWLKENMNIMANRANKNAKPTTHEPGNYVWMKVDNLQNLHHDIKDHM